MSEVEVNSVYSDYEEIEQPNGLFLKKYKTKGVLFFLTRWSFSLEPNTSVFFTWAYYIFYFLFFLYLMIALDFVVIIAILIFKLFKLIGRLLQQLVSKFIEKTVYPVLKFIAKFSIVILIIIIVLYRFNWIKDFILSFFDYLIK